MMYDLRQQDQETAPGQTENFLHDAAGAPVFAVAGGDKIPSPLLSVVVPTFNESGNIKPLLQALEASLAGHSWELIIVDDDSPDGTSQIAREIASSDRRVRCIRRIGRRGLSTAVIEGMLASSSEFVAVMDGDLQHDESLLPSMLDTLASGEVDVVIGSRFAEGGSSEGLDGPMRQLKSALGNTLARRLLGVSIQDPMSGFFAMRQQRFETLAPRLSGEGFKILLDILASSPEPLRTRELAMTFRTRLSGDSKLDLAVQHAFAVLLIDKTLGRYLPTRFILFSAIGGLGVGVHLAMLGGALHFAIPFAFAQALAATTAMTSNYWLNNLCTYADRRLRGWKFVVGLISFYAVCGVGLIGNVGIASEIFAKGNQWWLAGVTGALVGAVWNYAVSSVVTWGRK